MKPLDSKDVIFKQRIPEAETIISGKKEKILANDLMKAFFILEKLLTEKYNENTAPGITLYKKFSEIKYNYLKKNDLEEAQKQLINFYRSKSKQYFKQELQENNELNQELCAALGIY